MKKNIHMVMLGDSIIGRGDWKRVLFQGQILNLGVDGDTTKGILNRLDSVINLEPKLLFLMIGINDFCNSIPLNEIFENYKNILQKLKNNNINVIVHAILLTQMKSVNKKVLEFNKLLQEYCKKEEFTFFDMNPYLCENELLKESFTTDGLHLNFKAYTLWANEIKGNPFYHLN
ncbi:MAG: GDSL-type esterase/lipase family protein [Halarcobacter sp.]